MKKTLLIKTLGLLVIVGGLASCNNDNTLYSNSLNEEQEKTILKENQSVLAKQATTSLQAMKLLDTSSIQNSIQPKVKNAYTISSEDETTITKLLSQFDLILENNNYFTSTIETSDKTEYKTKETITFTSLNDQSTSYTLYYNDVISNTKTEVDDGETEITTTINYSGIAVFFDNNLEVTYQFTSESETSVEGNETEIESTFKLYSKQTSTYIEVEKENETENSQVEDEYSYKLVQNGKVVYDYSIEISKNSITNEKEIELELNEKEYKVTKYESGNDEFFKVKLENDITDEEVVLIYKKIINNEIVTYELQQ